jgi:SPP1 gp7 family putative phage head morphogenesis protein
MSNRQKIRKERNRKRERWLRARRSSRYFTSNLLQVAKQIDFIVKGFAPDGYIKDPVALNKALSQYADMLPPWAAAVSTKMIADVSHANADTFKQVGKDMGRALLKEINAAPIGDVMRGLLAEQVTLISGLPLRAAERIHELTIEGITKGTRANVIAEEILKSGEVSAFNARRIARTEVSRTASTLTEARAKFVGSEGYIWRSVEDSDVRNKDGNPEGSHRLLNGTYIRWDSPPVASTDGTKAHAGCIYFCRCFPEPVIPE